MKTRGLSPGTKERMPELIGAEPGAADGYLSGLERRDEILRLIRQDEAENEEFYRELGPKQ